MEKIKALYKAVQLLRFLMRMRHWLPVWEGIVKLAEDAAKQGRPMTSKIMIDAGAGNAYEFVSLWVGAGDANPVSRLREVCKERDDLQKIVDSKHRLIQELESKLTITP